MDSGNLCEQGMVKISPRGDFGEFPEGPRCKKLFALMNKVLSSTVKSFSYEKIESTFPNLAKAQPERFKKVYEEAVATWNSSVNESFKTILKKYDLVKKLNKIDHYIDTQTPIIPLSEDPFAVPEANKRARVLLQSDPKAIVRAAKIEELRKEIKIMKRKRYEIEKENEKLYDMIIKRRRTVADEVVSFNHNLSEAFKIITMLASEDCQSLLDSTAALSTKGDEVGET